MWVYRRPIPPMSIDGDLSEGTDVHTAVAFHSFSLAQSEDASRGSWAIQSKSGRQLCHLLRIDVGMSKCGDEMITSYLPLVLALLGYCTC